MINNDQSDEKLNKFLNFCKLSNIEIDYNKVCLLISLLSPSLVSQFLLIISLLSLKVQITKQSTSHNYGMVAICDIKEDETIVHIPKTSLLQPNTTEIKDILKLSKKIHF
jgi:hypothetical protein